MGYRDEWEKCPKCVSPVIQGREGTMSVHLPRHAVLPPALVFLPGQRNFLPVSLPVLLPLPVCLPLPTSCGKISHFSCLLKLYRDRRKA